MATFTRSAESNQFAPEDRIVCLNLPDEAGET